MQKEWLFVVFSVVFVSLLIDLLPAVAMAPEISQNTQRQECNTYVGRDCSPPSEYAKIFGEAHTEEPPKHPADSSWGEWVVAWIVWGLSFVTANSVMAVFTIVLAWVAWQQVRVYRRQARYMLRGLRLTRESNKASRDSASAAKESADAATKTFLLTQRPKLRIRNVSIDSIPLGPAKDDHLFKQGDIAIGVEFFIINIGNAVAKICEKQCEGICTVFFANNPLPMKPPYPFDFSLPAMAYRGLQPGEVKKISVHIARTSDDTQDGVLKTGYERLYVMGYVDYEDELGLTRRTAYCRVLTPGARYFRIEKNPDYEYED